MTTSLHLPPAAGPLAGNQARTEDERANEPDALPLGLIQMFSSAGSALPPMEQLQRRLVDEARREDLIDIAYRTVDTPIGQLLLAATPKGMVRWAFALEDHDAVLADLAVRISPRVLHTPRLFDEAAAQLEQYFAARRTRFELPVDLRLTQGFRRQVVEHLADVAYGTTASYGSIAVALGRPAAARAVGTACARNPLPVLLPCHRVVRSDGSVGHYLGGTAAKHALLNLEGAT